jgi:3,4-dihydroxy 2-butanone 4-phosphate synthase/GTP cyclohydrolase II
VYGLDGLGLSINKRIPIEIEAQQYDEFYMLTKEKKMGHIFLNESTKKIQPKYAG